jgi:hypothetical protein
MFVASVVVCTVVQPGYDSKYSFRRNCFNGFEVGVVIGLTWPFTIPLIVHRRIKNIVDSDPIIKKVGTPDWTQDWRLKIEKLIKKKDDEDDDGPRPATV